MSEVRMSSCPVSRRTRMRQPSTLLRLPDASGGHRDRAGDLSRVRDEARPVGNAALRPPRPQPSTGARRATTHGDGLEWEDLMPEINRASDTSNMIWQLIDRETGAENGAISWTFTVGDRVKIRLVNEMESDHPMHHPFHIHGAGRFLVLSRDDEPEANLVWKDTVLVRVGTDGGHPARRVEPWALDGALPHRRTQPERHDVQLQRRATPRSVAILTARAGHRRCGP